MIDLTVYGNDITLEDIERAFNTSKDQDYVLITPWQQKHIFSSIFGDFKYWRGIPIKVKEVSFTKIQKK